MYKHNRCINCSKCLIKCNHEECKPFGRCLHVCPENCLSISGKTVTLKYLAEEIKNSADILGSAFGGVTFSCGEPLFQQEFLLDVIDNLDGINKCI